MSGAPGVRKVRGSRFPLSLVAIYLGSFLLLSGLHTGLIVLMEAWTVSASVQTIVPILYWLAASMGLTAFTRYKMKQVYEEPVRKLAEATARVTQGDFSVYVPPLHTPDQQDYLDVMIHDFNRMVEALGSIETLKTDFFSNVSHEIKTPLAVIQNTAELLRSKALPTEERQAHVETILGASQRLSALITNILKLNKLEKQTITPELQIYDLPGQLAKCALQHESVWEKKVIQFEAELDDRAAVTADPSLMELVWNNLLSNALKFTAPGGTVTLKQWTEEDVVVVEVADSGCGMDEETIRHVFDKFYQGDPSHSTEGNGLGLTLAWRVAQMMNAELTVTSAPGTGSVFTVRMPRAETASFHETET